jgi:hypothetical protein
MDDIKPNATDKLTFNHSQTLGPSPEALARKFFILTMAGLLAYVAAILLLTMGSN